MVVFSCDGCGEMLKKSQVDGHANRCRRCDSVSCVDCSVSFWGGTYCRLTTCIIIIQVTFGFPMIKKTYISIWRLCHWELL